MSLPNKTGIIIYKELERDIQYLVIQTSCLANSWEPPQRDFRENEDKRDATFQNRVRKGGIHRQIGMGLAFEYDYRHNGINVLGVYYIYKELNMNRIKNLLPSYIIEYKWCLFEKIKSDANMKHMAPVFEEAEHYLKPNNLPASLQQKYLTKDVDDVEDIDDEDDTDDLPPLILASSMIMDNYEDQLRKKGYDLRKGNVVPIIKWSHDEL